MPAKGQAIFAKCTACHTIKQGGANGIGPNLCATVGEPIGKGKARVRLLDAISPGTAARGTTTTSITG